MFGRAYFSRRALLSCSPESTVLSSGGTVIAKIVGVAKKNFPWSILNIWRAPNIRLDIIWNHFCYNCAKLQKKGWKTDFVWIHYPILEIVGVAQPSKSLFAQPLKQGPRKRCVMVPWHPKILVGQPKFFDSIKQNRVFTF